MDNLLQDERLIIKAFQEHPEHIFFYDTVEKDIPLYNNSISCHSDIRKTIENLITRLSTNSPIEKITCSKGNTLYYALQGYYTKKEPYSTEDDFSSPEMLGEAKDARESLKKKFEDEETTIFLYIAITSHTAFPIMLPERVEEKRKTVFLMSDKDCLHHDKDKEEWTRIKKEWINFILSSKERKKYVRLYLVNKKIKNEDNIVSDKYRSLYTSLLTKNSARFNYYQYTENGLVKSGVGELLGSKDKNNSLYDIVKQEYTQAWNDRIAIRKINFWSAIGRFIINWILWIIIGIISVIVLFISAIYSVVATESPNTFSKINSSISTILTIIPIVSLIIGSVLEKQIRKFFQKQKLKF